MMKLKFCSFKYNFKCYNKEQYKIILLLNWYYTIIKHIKINVQKMI